MGNPEMLAASRSETGGAGRKCRVATDVGGTFTDAVVMERGRLRSVKVSSTPPDFERGIADALTAASVRLGETSFFAHGSTVVINALTERRGARTGLITTDGFRDVLEIARGNTPDLFNAAYRKPRPFVPRRLRLEVRERMSHSGQALAPLDEAAVANAARQLHDQGVEAIAICFLHAYANPAHEKQALAVVNSLGLGVEAIASHQASALWREYERASTAVLSAYVLPPTSAYLQRLAGNLARDGLRTEPLIMQSNGGLTRISEAAANPISLVESGPAAGVFGAAAYGKLIAEQHLISLDIGGTTAKCSLIENGDVRITTDYCLEKTPASAGYPISAPVVDIMEIGNGGGSIAWLDAAGSLHVGPQSAGARPGPVAYGCGGGQPTTTDAHLLLGNIDAERLTGGEGPPDLDAVRRAFGALGDALGVSARQAALGTVRIANANMVNALKLVSVNRGRDPRDFALFAMGGGAGLHAASLAADLGMPRVIIPPHSAVFSAWAMLMVGHRRDLMRTSIHRLDAGSMPWLRDRFAEMEREARRGLGADGGIQCKRQADLRYVGQEHTVKVEFDPSETSPGTLEARFHSAHEREFAFRLEVRIEIVNLHLVALRPLPGDPLAPIQAAKSPDPAPARLGRRTLHADSEGKVLADVFAADRLLQGMEIAGPAVVERAGGTVIVPRSARATLDRFGGLRLNLMNEEPNT